MMENVIMSYGHTGEKMDNNEYQDEKYDSLYEAIENKDKEAIKRFDEQTKKGKVIRIM